MVRLTLAGQCRKPVPARVFNSAYEIPFPLARGDSDARTRTDRSAPGGTDRLRRLPARAGAGRSRTHGGDAPRARCLGADDRGRRAVKMRPSIPAECRKKLGAY